jgi:hypothetical protein
VLLLSLVAMAGCTASTCRDDAVYLSSRAVDPLRMPEGIAPPPDDQSLEIPGGGAGGQGGAKDSSGRCLGEPPRYYAEAGETDAGLPPRPGSEVPASAAAAAGAGPLAGASRLTLDVAAFLEQWADAWNRRDADAWIEYYQTDFAPAGYGSHEDWVAAQRQRFEIPAVTEVDTDSLGVETEADGTVRARFVQRFGTPPDVRGVVKEMVLEPRPQGRGWRIASERIADIL